MIRLRPPSRRPGGSATAGRRPLLAALLAALLLGGPRGAQPLAAQQGAAPAAVPPGVPFAFRGVTVIDVTTGRRLTDQTVVIVGNRIKAVGPVRTTRVPQGANIVDARGKYVIPGLWDMHAHVTHLKEDGYARMVRSGITGFRDPTSGADVRRAVLKRDSILNGKYLGPPRQVLGAVVEPTYAPTVFDSLKRAGADMFKFWTMERAEDYFLLARQTRRVGLRFGGHMNKVTPAQISDSGASIIDHVGLWLSGGLDTLCVPNARPDYQRASVAACRPAADHLRRNGTWWVVTMTELLQTRVLVESNGFRPRPESMALIADYVKGVCGTRVRPDSAGLLGIAYRAGVPILAGTDVVGVAGAPETLIYGELAIMVSEGMPPLAALQTATLNPAKFLHATDSLGTVAPGKLADLVLLDDDPLEEITNTAHVWAVVANGRYVEGKRPCH